MADEEVFGFSGNVFIESIDANERRKQAAERAEMIRKEEAEKKRLRRQSSLKKGLSYTEKLEAQKREQDAELEAKKRNNRLSVIPTIDERPKTPEAPLNLEVPSVSEQEAKGKVQATWELKIASGQKEQPSDSELPAKTLPVTRINAKPNNFAGKGPQTHVPGGAYVSDRLLEAHRRMKATGRSDEELLTSAMQASAPKPKSLYRASDAVMSRANAWISSFAVESVEDMERRFQMELEQNRSQ